MNRSTQIRLLAATNNERGDLFTRLAGDLFFALGYDELRFDVHKSGRELDLQGKHRLESRRVIGECKAHADKMGGAELNKFFGALTRERKRSAPIPITGYFISLSGFTETGIEQEDETDEDRIILLDAPRVIEELERCRVIVSFTTAAERAGHCAQHAGLQNPTLAGGELLGHKIGYLWAIYYTHSKERTHVALIHADGTPLSETVAKEVIAADQLCGGSLNSLRYLVPPIPATDSKALSDKVATRYRQWLGEECGYIHLDGLPADTDLSATRLKLERLFVPLKATMLPKPDDHTDVEQAHKDKVLSIGELLKKQAPHLALLAMPGGGKSTLLKRLATAYAFTERHGEVADDLPQHEWLPLILRCRELRDRAHRPILELLDDIPRHAGMDNAECAIFREAIHASLHSGRILLLIDGLDEISEEGARQTFAKHLRTFIAMFPQAALVVTSREAGFRLVAGVVASACEQAKLAPLDENDVLNLCERWHVEVVGDNDKVRTEAKELGQTIWDNQRIRTLTENPLLLTTLLVVKRCIRELPRSRTALYREAIRVLVRTWNVEGYDPMDEDETLAQLSYVACAMMEAGKQQIDRKALLRLLQSACRELEAELQFARISPQDFIQRIEYRSSLLMQTGHERIDGVLEPVYEFRHLTFQEYLAARGYVEEQYPGRDSGHSLADVLECHFEDERWSEVIPLAAVLAGRKAEELIKRLTTACESRSQEEMPQVKSRQEPLISLLYQSIRDEVQVTSPTLKIALRELARTDPEPDSGAGWILAILRGKFGAIFQEVVEQAYLAGGLGIEEYLLTLSDISDYLFFGDQEAIMSDAVATSLFNALETGDRLQRIRAALVCMRLAYNNGRVIKGDDAEKSILQCRFQPLAGCLHRMLDSGDLPSALAASWAFAWLGEHRMLANPPESEMILSLYRLWRQLESNAQGRYPAWALSEQQLLPRDTFNHEVWGDCESFLRHKVPYGGIRWRRITLCALVVGWYRQSPWSDAELVDHLSKCIQNNPFFENPIRELLENLGDAGRHVLEERERKKTAREDSQCKQKMKKSSKDSAKVKASVT